MSNKQLKEYSYDELYLHYFKTCNELRNFKKMYYRLKKCVDTLQVDNIRLEKENNALHNYFDYFLEESRD